MDGLFFDALGVFHWPLVNHVLFQDTPKYTSYIEKICDIFADLLDGRVKPLLIGPSNVLLLQLRWHYLLTYYILIINRGI